MGKGENIIVFMQRIQPCQCLIFRKNLRLPKFFFHQHQDKKIKAGTGEKDDEKEFHKAAQKEHEFIRL
jgi:hypothetical protein